MHKQNLKRKLSRKNSETKESGFLAGNPEAYTKSLI